MLGSRMLAVALAGIASISIVGVAMAHPGGIVDRADVLARALGITSDEVEQAREDGTLRDLVGDLTLNQLSDAYGAEVDDAIDQALADGAITQAQADRLKSLLDDSGGEFAFGFGGLGRLGPRFDDADRQALEDLHGLDFSLRIDLKSIYMDLLGLTEDQFNAAREDGTLRDLIDGLDPVAVQAAIVDARDAKIDAALAAGDITQEQADALRDLPFGLGGFPGGPGRGLGGGHFGGPGGHFEFRFRGGDATPDDGSDSGSSESSGTGISI